jgi:hypothetical protein
MDDNYSGLSLFVIFTQGFDVSAIYEIGWIAAREWMAIASGVLLAIAISIRSLEEKVNLLSGGQGGYLKMVTNVLLIASAMGLYFLIASLVINLCNALYGVLDNSTVVDMGKKLDAVMLELRTKDHKFSWSEIGDSALSIFALLAYWLTHMILILVTVFMRIAHALLISWCLFWGAVALPMSVVTGLKMLNAFKTVTLFALLWPIVESFFMFAVAGSFSLLLDSTQLDVSQFKTWNMGVMVFFLSAFAIINLLLCACLIGAPFIAMGLANGTGNVSGMIGSFAGAAVASGMIAAKAFAPKPLLNAAQNNIFSALSKPSGGMSARNQLAQSGVGSAQAAGGRRSYSPTRSTSTRNNNSTTKATANSSATTNQTNTTNTSSANNQAASQAPAGTSTASATNNLSSNLPGNSQVAKSRDVSKSPSETTDLESTNLPLNDEQRKRKSRAGRAGYFANKARLNPKNPN